jgi:hypothetical protein
VAADNNRVTVDNDGTSVRHLPEDGEDLGDVVGPGDRSDSRIYRQLIDDVAWRCSKKFLGSLKDCGLAGLTGK